MALDPAPNSWPEFLGFLRDWIFLPAAAALAWIWREMGQMKLEHEQQLTRIEMSVGRMADSFAAHSLDDLRRFADKDDLQILRADVIGLRQHLDERLNRLGDLIATHKGRS